MFAPGSGRYLGLGFGILVVLSAIEAAGLFPRTLGVVLLLLFGWGVWIFFASFFRDPDRPIADGIVSAADGRVRTVEKEGESWRISVFMNITDVHVNRFPTAARVESIADSGEGFRPAYQDDAEHNVQRRFALSSPLGPIEVVQMTGIFARRLVSFVRVGDALARGERFGMIVLGSRVDVLLPAARSTPTVSAGTRVRAGATTIARELP